MVDSFSKVEQYLFGSSGRNSKTSKVWEHIRKISRLRGDNRRQFVGRAKVNGPCLLMPNNKFNSLTKLILF